MLRDVHACALTWRSPIKITQAGLQLGLKSHQLSLVSIIMHHGIQRALSDAAGAGALADGLHHRCAPHSRASPGVPSQAGMQDSPTAPAARQPVCSQGAKHRPFLYAKIVHTFLGCGRVSLCWTTAMQVSHAYLHGESSASGHLNDGSVVSQVSHSC